MTTRVANPSSEQPAQKKAKMTNGAHSGNGHAAAADKNGAEAMHTDVDIDHNLYSRQLYTIGADAMRLLRTSSVLCSGLDATGVEIAKNLVLGGVRHLTVHDEHVATWADLSGQFYLNEADLGKNRALASHGRLAELNDTVTVQHNEAPLTEQLVKQFDIVVLCGYEQHEQLKVSAMTRAHGKKLIVADTRGLFGLVFCDFGPAHQIRDPNGEQPLQVLIEHIDKTTGEVSTLEEAMHGLEDGDHVLFNEIKGMTELNDHVPLKLTVKTPTKFVLDPESLASMSVYKEGGVARQVKMPKTVKFLPLDEAMKAPEFVITDFAKMERPAQLHVLWQAVSAFQLKHKRMPAPRCKTDAAEVMATATELNGKDADPLDETLAAEFAMQQQGNVCPMASFVGGVAAQEAMKAIAGLYTPIQQFMYFDALECLPAKWCPEFDAATLTKQDCAPKNSRYDGMAAVFGWKYLTHLASQRWFVVGAGAIGCELLKNLAMMGIATAEDGLITITDPDTIETSNLNRQFLFRRHDIGDKKSEVAARSVKSFNSSLNIKALAERVGPETEQLFDDVFFEKLHGVINALDNVEARRYVDRRIVFYELPLLESGTMGPKCNTQVVYPHLTESYSSSSDPPEKSIPICTLKHFPYAIEHTIQWSRDLFEGKFTYPAEQANKYLEDQRAFDANTQKMNPGQRLEVYNDVKRALVDERPKTAADCVRWARNLFQHEFYNEIAQLLKNFPADQVTGSGVKFWSGTKRCPKVVVFDINNPEHFEFVFSGAYIRALLYNLAPIEDRAEVASICAEHSPPEFKAADGVRIAVNDAEAQQMGSGGMDVEQDVESVVQSVLLALAKDRVDTLKPLTPVDFEKDDDSNHHVDVVTAASNLRADNYSIEKADRYKTKQIAGRIIPAIATTTAAVAGLVCHELFKCVAAGPNKHDVPMEIFKNSFCNIALPFFAFSEPMAAPKRPFVIAGRTHFTLWDSISIKETLTLQQLIDMLKEKYQVDVTMMSSGVSMLYAFFQNAKTREARLNMPIDKLVASVSQKPIPGHMRWLVLEPVASEIESGEDIEMPYIRYRVPV
jgi:ubiquitin-activating enzyme E1